MSRGRVFFPNLDGLRFIAFFFVFLEHASQKIVPLVPMRLAGWRVFDNFILENGELGVSIFFVLSGFLITYLLLTEIRLTGRFDLPSFYARRALRIWPLYYAVVVFGFAVYPWLKGRLGMESPQIPDVPLYLVFLGNFVPIRAGLAGIHLPIFSTVLWSVAVEEQFYLLWPLLFVWMPKKGRAWIFAVIILGSLVFRAVHREEHDILYFHTLSVIGDLAMGGAAAYAAVRWQGFEGFFERLAPAYRLGAYCAGMASFVLWPIVMERDPGWVFARIWFGAFFAFVILDQCFQRAPGFKFSGSRLVTFWGKYTYGLYLLHAIVLTLLLAAFKGARIPWGTPWRDLAVGVLGLGLSLALSYASFHTLEAPFLRLKKRLSFISREG